MTTGISACIWKFILTSPPGRTDSPVDLVCSHLPELLPGQYFLSLLHFSTSLEGFTLGTCIFEHFKAFEKTIAYPL
jgi:hypothetical protein